MSIGDTTYPLPPQLTLNSLIFFLLVFFLCLISENRSKFNREAYPSFEKWVLSLIVVLVYIVLLIVIPMLGSNEEYSNLYLMIMSIPAFVMILLLAWGKKTNDEVSHGADLESPRAHPTKKDLFVAFDPVV
ncbi:MAG: hypothetical protein ACXAAO_06180 [Candidatus Thorarchaeota archaeon]|jgi:protein-S-isoprenylcysteine O-methyltransferase Ste14